MRIAWVIVLLMLMSSCFTGIEGTRRISESDVRRHSGNERDMEENYLGNILPLPPHAWLPGKRILVTDERFGRLTGRMSAAVLPAELRFVRFEPARTLTGDDATDIVFNDTEGRQVIVRDNRSMQTMDTVAALVIPFTVDPDIASACDSVMRGHTFYISSSLWYDAEGQALTGRRHVAVKIDSVSPGDDNYAAYVHFTDKGHRYVKMNVGADGGTRTFNRLFSLTDPRKRYPAIHNEDWELITQGKVRQGMSRDECRLALGAPASVLRTPSTAGMREMWTYQDGVYLIFEDGMLDTFRL